MLLLSSFRAQMADLHKKVISALDFGQNNLRGLTAVRVVELR